MKNISFAVLFLYFFLIGTPSFANDEGSSQVSYPDLLDDSFLDDEGFDEGFDESPRFIVSDPLESMNRVFFEFNDTFYEWFLKPITNGYIWVVPRELRVSFANVFYNLASPIRLLNSLLQADFNTSGVVIERFIVNSTLGVYGLVDIASIEFDMRPVKADFGQTLGRWGVGEGIYFCWPIIGPSTSRDSVGWIVDLYTHPIPYLHDSRLLDSAYYFSSRVNTISLHPTLYDDLKRFAIDPYVASRQAYYEFRSNFVQKKLAK